jgi:hypothetical protein
MQAVKTSNTSIDQADVITTARDHFFPLRHDSQEHHY